MATAVGKVQMCASNSGATRMLFLLLRTVVVVEILTTFSVTAAPTIRSDTQAMIYLSNFGYLSAMSRNPSSGTIISEDTMVKAIVDFQAFAGINQTGLLDNATQEAMSLPRCGVRDKVGFGSSSRSKRYALQGSRWKVKDLTYKISKYPSKLDRSQVDSELDKAFKVWSDYTDLSFTAKRSGQVHIEVRFEKGEHGDGDPFDGPGGTLAHAYFPVYGGDAHFDDAEQWSINSFRGTNLFQVAAHEFGHSLGLSHSDVRAALMAPFYRGYDPSFTLDTDDIQGIQALYGKKSSTAASNPPKTTSKAPSYNTPAPKEDNELCKAATMDTIFTSAQGATYVFKGEKYWKLTDDGVAPGYPRPISKTWIGLPNNLDAAFTYRNGKTYFFKGSQYWRYTDKVMDGDYPKLISEGFTGIPDNVDVALMWSGNGKIYFFKGQKFWRFDPSQKPPVKSTYPKLISNWEGLPNNLEAALQYTDGYTYFFKNGMYYRFNDRTFSVDTADPPFPRGAGYWWFGCTNERSGIVNSGKWGSSYLDGIADAPAGFNHGSERRDEANQGHNSDVDDLIFDGADIVHPSHDVPHSASKSSASSITVHLMSAILMIAAILFA